MKAKEFDQIAYVRQWKKKNPDKVKRYTKKYYLKHRDRLILKGGKYRKKNRETLRIKNKEYYRKNIENIIDQIKLNKIIAPKIFKGFFMITV